MTEQNILGSTPNIPTVREALTLVMKDVGAVRKDERNAQQGFNFRGVDTVMKAVYPALVKYGVLVTPKLISQEYSTVEVGQKKTSMGHCRVVVTYVFWGPRGDVIEATVAAEAMDSGDKATAKAMSVAMRTALLQSLCLPTDEPDPDASTYERTPQREVTPAEVQSRLNAAAEALSTDVESLTGKYRRENGDLTMEQFRALPIVEQANLVNQIEAYIHRTTN